MDIFSIMYVNDKVSKKFLQPLLQITCKTMLRNTYLHIYDCFLPSTKSNDQMQMSTIDTASYTHL